MEEQQELNEKVQGSARGNWSGNWNLFPFVVDMAGISRRNDWKVERVTRVNASSSIRHAISEFIKATRRARESVSLLLPKLISSSTQLASREFASTNL